MPILSVPLLLRLPINNALLLKVVLSACIVYTSVSYPVGWGVYIFGGRVAVCLSVHSLYLIRQKRNGRLMVVERERERERERE